MDLRRGHIVINTCSSFTIISLYIILYCDSNISDYMYVIVARQQLCIYESEYTCSFHWSM